jgi:choline dehydrogenase
MEADYVIVGSGSAGSALAYRLAEAGRSVIVIEYGGSDAGPFIKMPGALSYPMNMSLYDWGFRTRPEPGLGGRTLACPRGKVIGGSSSINGMVYVRGHAGDFETWEQMGASGWGYGDVLPYYRRMETWHGAHDGGDPAWRGTDGPLHVSRGPRNNPLTRAWVEAGAQAGYDTPPDYNGERQEGIGALEATIWQGRRWSAADAYLRPALRTGNATLVHGLATRVEFSDGRATGVQISRGNGREIIRARAEVILAASSINTPKLLMLSGIGPGAHLRDTGIEVLADRPGVGANLQDHLEVYVQTAAIQPVSLYSYWNLPGKALVGASWLFGRTGPGTSNQIEAGGFIRSAPGIRYPDIQFHFLPIAVRYDGAMAHKGHGFQVHTGPMRSKSRGHVRLAGPGAETAPEIFFNYMSDPEDWAVFRAGIRAVREILDQPAFVPFKGHEIQPGDEALSDAALDDFVREHAESAYHPCGTARIGASDDPLAVVDPDLKVIGVDGLRVADSSVFPQITNGNLNAPSIMTGEKAADHILGRRLPRDDRAAWFHPEWETAQR